MKKRRKAAKIFGVLLLVGFLGGISVSIYLYHWSAPFRDSAKTIDLSRIVPPSNDALTAAQKALILERVDPRFYEHNGIDFFAITKAICSNLFRDGPPVHVPGTQTLTLSVALSLLPEPQSGMEIYSRHTTSYFLAPRLEEHFTKEEILQLYISMEDTRRLEKLKAHSTGPNKPTLASPTPPRVD